MRVCLDGRPLVPDERCGVVLHRPASRPVAIVHPGPLAVVLPLPVDGPGGIELLLADTALAERLADPRFPVAQLFRDGIRQRLAGIDLGDLEEGAWRQLAPRELETIRLGVRLPPRPSR